MWNKILLEDMENIYDRKIDWDIMEGKTVLLTGAYGMLASYITFYISYLNLIKKINVRLVAVVKSQEKFKKKFPEIINCSFVSVVESNLLNPLMINEKVDYIIHAASLASPQYYDTCPVDVLAPNVIGTYHMLNLAFEKKVQGFLLFSTGDIYGNTNGIKDVTENDYGSLDTLDIHNCYSESKRMAETMCKAFLSQYNVPIKIARIWHTYAPTMDIETDSRVFSSFVKNIIEGKDIEMKSDGSGKRSFCYITDAIAGYFSILLYGTVGEAYNVCNSKQYMSILELAEKLVEIYPEENIHVIKKERDRNEHYVENSLLVDSISVPSEKKLQSLGWETQVSVSEGFKRVIDYIRSIHV